LAECDKIHRTGINQLVCAFESLTSSKDQRSSVKRSSQLLNFVAVAEELNVRQAATRLHLSQPPLSRQIHDLEDEVGTKLFVRSKSGMGLTEAGRIFLKEARSILTQSQRVAQLAQAASRGEAGHLDIAYSPEVLSRFFCA
jgi:DNA-binding transcriptional LysR family regulator